MVRDSAAGSVSHRPACNTTRLRAPRLTGYFVSPALPEMPQPTRYYQHHFKREPVDSGDGCYRARGNIVDLRCSQ